MCFKDPLWTLIGRADSETEKSKGPPGHSWVLECDWSREFKLNISVMTSTHPRGVSRIFVVTVLSWGPWGPENLLGSSWPGEFLFGCCLCCSRHCIFCVVVVLVVTFFVIVVLVVAFCLCCSRCCTLIVLLSSLCTNFYDRSSI